MHLGRQIWEFFWLVLSLYHIIEFPHHSTFCVYVIVNSCTPSKACLISNILGAAHTSTCPLEFVDYIYTALMNLYHSCFHRISVLMLFWIAGPVHMDEMLYLFPQNHLLPNLKLTREDEDMVETMTSLWVNFAHTGYVTHVLYFSVLLIYNGRA
jgi:hypothetical protein